VLRSVLESNSNDMSLAVEAVLAMNRDNGSPVPEESIDIASAQQTTHKAVSQDTPPPHSSDEGRGVQTVLPKDFLMVR
jgi:hypothetical protein